MRYVALLRAVNVGGTAKLPMADLRKLVESLGYGAVTTYIASGNVIFDARGSEATIAGKIEDVLRSKLKLDTDVLVRTAAQLEPLVHDHAFADRGAEGSRLHVVFLRDAPTKSAIAKLDASRSPGDEILVRGREIHWHTPNGAGQSKLSMAYFERVLATPGTTRNHNTVTKLYALLARA
jgi:uncharacterized protein (DUF1697 family)